MERLVRVADMKARGNGSTFLDLADLLPVFEPEAHGWTWAIPREPWITADDRWDLNLPVLIDQIKADPRGLAMSFADLKRLADSVVQVVTANFIAANSPNLLPLRSADAATVGSGAVAGLAAIDSTFWLVGGPGPMIDRVAATFSAVEELHPTGWIHADEY